MRVQSRCACACVLEACCDARAVHTGQLQDMYAVPALVATLENANSMHRAPRGACTLSGGCGFHSLVCCGGVGRRRSLGRSAPCSAASCWRATRLTSTWRSLRRVRSRSHGYCGQAAQQQQQRRGLADTAQRYGSAADSTATATSAAVNAQLSVQPSTKLPAAAVAGARCGRRWSPLCCRRPPPSIAKRDRQWLPGSAVAAVAAAVADSSSRNSDGSVVGWNGGLVAVRSVDPRPR